ncbi:MAG TPA: hypothetical protein VMT85_23390 [Thermoanaerobaculia bacterium]|nr:hypothetical protein [Thermoanaerobaculia bacterium]
MTPAADKRRCFRPKYRRSPEAIGEMGGAPALGAGVPLRAAEEAEELANA